MLPIEVTRVLESLTGFRYQPCAGFGVEGYYFLRSQETEDGAEFIFFPNGLDTDSVMDLFGRGFRFQDGLLFMGSVRVPVFLVIEKSRKAVVSANSIEDGDLYVESYKFFMELMIAVQPVN